MSWREGALFLVDVNVLVYAFRQDSPGHERFAHWLQDTIDGAAAFGMADLVSSGFLRVVTHPNVFNPPSPYQRAIAFLEQVRSRPNCVRVVPGARHWEIFTTLCRATRAVGNAVPDAFLAALAIEAGCEWITTDRGFATGFL
jgi:toxin-antitoxin system PIN domain toxin